VAQALQSHHAAEGVGPAERALENRFVAQAGEAVRPAVRLYAALSLARRAEISARADARSPLTETLLFTATHRVAAFLADAGQG
jgi:hypothetical protein